MKHQNSWQAQCQCKSLFYWKDSYYLCDFQTRRRCWSANLCKALYWCFLILLIIIKATETSERNLWRSEFDLKMSLQIHHFEAAQQVFQFYLLFSTWFFESSELMTQRNSFVARSSTTSEIINSRLIDHQSRTSTRCSLMKNFRWRRL